uniref:F-box protein AT5G49610-like beta-propeller domain-containing protein n=1 Tax=Arundo donax TaxID=35708 RepID=A0A0A9EZY5_ARUDO
MLGFLCNIGSGSRFVPTSSFRPRGADRRGWRALDARHGRVLLHWDPAHSPFESGLVVWDPATGAWRGVPALPPWALYPYSWNAAVLCAAAGGGAGCDHLDCHRGHFLVVVVGTNQKEMFAYVYSSEAAAWSEPASAPHPQDSVDFAPSALVGNTLYFAFQMGTGILEYNLVTRDMAVIGLPPSRFYGQRGVLTTRDDGALGFARAEKSTLYLWSREPRPEGDAHWAQSRVIELDTLLPVDVLRTFSDVVSFVDGIGVIFVRTGDGLFTIDLKSRQVTKVCKDSGFSGIFPYMSFQTPALGLACTGEGPRGGASSD